MEIDIAQYPKTQKFIQNLNHPLFQGVKDNFQKLLNDYGDNYLELCEEVLILVETLGYDASKAYLKSTLLYMKDQARFKAEGVYNNGLFDDIRERVYDDRATMEETYLPGMILSYPFAAILYVKYDFFIKRFITLIGDNSRGIDIGFGPGFYIWQLLKRRQQVSVEGYDISRYSMEFAQRLLRAGNVESSRYKLSLGNLCNGIEEEDGCFDWCLLTEVLEHVPDPMAALGEVHRLLKPNGSFFMTTEIDSNHMDHLTNFSSLSEIECLLNDANFNVLFTKSFIVKQEFTRLDDATQSLAFICQKTEPYRSL